MQRLKLFVPLLVFLALAVLLYGSLGKDPEYLPSALVDKPMPDFQLGLLKQADKTVGKDALLGEPGLLNVWASWCYACRIEHPFITRLSTELGVPVFGLNYKNDPDEAIQWLEQFGDPYRFSLMDRDGRLGIDLGVAGAPETFVFDRHGVIHHRHIGVVDEKVWQDTLLPLLQKLRSQS